MSGERKFRPCCPNPFGCIGEDGCCTEPFTFAPTLEIRASKVRDCFWNTCGFMDENRPQCDKTFYSTQTIVVTYANGSVETTTRVRSLEELGCTQTATRDCVKGPNGEDCVGVGTSIITYSGIVPNPINVAYYDENGVFSGYDNSCFLVDEEYRPYRYGGPNFTFWEDLCNTIPYPEEYPFSWSFVTAAVNFDLSSNLCPFGFNEQNRKINLKYRIRHHAQATCYLKVWIRISTQKQNLVVIDPSTPCCKYLQSAGEPTREFVTYEWDGEGRPCFQEVLREDGSIDFTACESVIYSEDFPEIVAGENEIKTVSIWKWSFVKGYEPNNPDPPQEIAEIWGDTFQGRYPNGFPIWPLNEDLQTLSQEIW